MTSQRESVRVFFRKRTRSIDWPPFGRLEQERGSRGWESDSPMMIREIGGKFRLIVGGNEPSIQQCNGLNRLLSNWTKIRDCATAEICQLRDAARENAVLQSLSAEELEAGWAELQRPSDIWSTLDPYWIVIHEPETDLAEDLQIDIGFSVAWDDEHLVTIVTIGAEFYAV